MPLSEQSANVQTVASVSPNEISLGIRSLRCLWSRRCWRGRVSALWWGCARRVLILRRRCGPNARVIWLRRRVRDRGFSDSGAGSEPGAVWFCGAGAGGVAESSGFGVPSGAIGFSGFGATAGAAGSSAFGAGCGLGLRARLVRAGRSAFAGAAGAGFAAGIAGAGIWTTRNPV
jgi:hypothetical protein